MDAAHRKEIIVVVSTALYTLLFMLALIVVYQGQVATIALPLVTIIMGVLWVAILAIVMAIDIKQPALRWTFLALPPIIASVVSGFSGVALLGSLLLFMALVSAERNIRAKIDNHIKMKVVSVFRPGTRLILFGLAAMALSLALPDIKFQAENGEIALPPQTASQFLRPATPIISQYIPGYFPSMTIDQIIQNQINQQQIPAGFTLPPDQVSRSRQELSQQYNIELTGNETLPVVVSRIINRNIRNLAQSDGILVTLVLVLLALLAIRAIIPLLIWPILLIILGLIATAYKLRFLKKVTTPISIEKYQL